MGGEFEGELGEFMEAHDIRQYFEASEAPWQKGLVERNGGTWKAAARKTIKDIGARGFVAMRRFASMVNWAKKRPFELVWIFTSPMGHRSRTQIAMVTSG